MKALPSKDRARSPQKMVQRTKERQRALYTQMRGLNKRGVAA